MQNGLLCELVERMILKCAKPDMEITRLSALAKLVDTTL